MVSFLPFPIPASPSSKPLRRPTVTFCAAEREPRSSRQTTTSTAKRASSRRTTTTGWHVWSNFTATLQRLLHSCRHLLDGDHDCEHCHDLMMLRALTAYGVDPCKKQGGKSHDMDPFVVAFDRRSPGRNGHYRVDVEGDGSGNVDAICLDCDSLKSAFSLENFEVLLGTFVRFASTDLDSNKFLKLPSTPILKNVHEGDEDLLWDWATKKETQSQGHAEGKKVNLKRQDCYDLGRAVYVGNGLYRDPSGLDLPLHGRPLTTLSKTPRINLAFCKAVSDQHTGLKSSTLPDIPIMTYPRDVKLLPWPFTVADCFKKIWLNKAVQVAYPQMIAFLQIIIIAISVLLVDADWHASLPTPAALRASISGWPSTRALATTSGWATCERRRFRLDLRRTWASSERNLARQSKLSRRATPLAAKWRWLPHSPLPSSPRSPTKYE